MWVLGCGCRDFNILTSCFLIIQLNCKLASVRCSNKQRWPRQTCEWRLRPCIDNLNPRFHCRSFQNQLCQKISNKWNVSWLGLYDVHVPYGQGLDCKNLNYRLRQQGFIWKRLRDGSVKKVNKHRVGTWRKRLERIVFLLMYDSKWWQKYHQLLNSFEQHNHKKHYLSLDIFLVGNLCTTSFWSKN
jgi:hypothetical protein